MSDVAIYESASGQIAVTVEHDSVWLRQEQLAELFGRDRTVIGRHIRNVFAEGELERESNVQNLHIAGSDKPVTFYNLDVIISLGYRVKSREGTRFRQWANEVLKQHLTRGYSLNRERFEANARELEAALELVRKAARTPELGEAGGRGLVEIVSRYTQTFLWLQRYDEGLLTEPTGSPGGELPDANQARRQLAELKVQLMARGEASDLFARERGDGLAALLGNLEQSVFGEPAYPSLESKAAHLLYFVVKNHPFADGNKRSGAYLFVDFLHRNDRLLDAEGNAVINDTGLAALTLQREQSRQQRFNEQLENMAAQQRELLAGIASAVQVTQQQSRQMAEQHQQLMTRLQQATEAAATSSKHMDSSANQLGLLSANLRQAADALGQRLEAVTQGVEAASTQNAALAAQLQGQASSLSQLQAALLEGAQRFEQAASEARNGFGDMKQTQQEFLSGVRHEFTTLGETLRAQVEAIEKQAEEWLRSYASEVRTQTEDRMNKWNEVSLAYADQMHRNVQAVSGILDELEAR